MKRATLPSLTTCIIFDLLGMSTYLLPVLGEGFDVIWAPISGIVFYFLFGMKKFALLGGVFAFIEEIAPGLDIIPTFTIAWLIKKYSIEKEMVKNIGN